MMMYVIETLESRRGDRWRVRDSDTDIFTDSELAAADFRARIRCGHVCRLISFESKTEVQKP